MTRVLSGVALAAGALAAILLLPIDGLRIVVCGLTLVAAHEYARLADVRGSAGRLLLMLAATAVCWWVSTTIPTPVVLGLTAALMWVAVHVLVLGRAVPFALGLVAPAYLGMPLGMLVAVHARGGWRATSLLIATVVVSDTAQYYSGRAFGRRLLAPAISPKKTIEGALGGALLGTVFMMAAGRSVVPGAPLGALALLGAGLVVLGICGDLFESRLKRAAGVKDSSALIPGHGGVLDRIDALLFATPAFYLFLGNV